MTRFLPRSLLSQVMLSLAVALLIAQGLSAVLLYRAAEQRREAGLLHAVAFELISGERRSDRRQDRGAQPREWNEKRSLRRLGPSRHAQGDNPLLRLPRNLRYSESPTSPLIAGEPRDSRREAALASIADRYGLEVAEVVVVERDMGDDPVLRAARDRFPELRLTGGPAGRTLLVAGTRKSGDATWKVVRVPIADDNRVPLITLVLQTFIMFAVLVGLLYFVLHRITGPLHALAERTQRFGQGGAPEPPLRPTGPEDVSRLIAAHNAMQARIGAMLDEKDVMLGAIGHDLKTPLAALRVRLESVDDDIARGKMVASIEDITRTLDEILSLARIGRTHAPPERTDLGALAASVVEEFEDMGDPVELLDGERLSAPVHLTWLKRGLRNLVSNALRYAGNAQVSILRDGGMAVLRVEDSGTGIPADRIADMLEPFTRGEASRNRETGGAGLGLTIARAVAEQHGGTLVLANRHEGGLRAEIRIPA